VAELSLTTADNQMQTTTTLDDNIEYGEVIDLYRANDWSSADKPNELLGALRNSHSLVTARVGSKLIGLGNAISDGHLVVYYPHLSPRLPKTRYWKSNDETSPNALFRLPSTDADCRWKGYRIL